MARAHVEVPVSATTCIQTVGNIAAHDDDALVSRQVVMLVQMPPVASWYQSHGVQWHFNSSIGRLAGDGLTGSRRRGDGKATNISRALQGRQCMGLIEGRLEL